MSVYGRPSLSSFVQTFYLCVYCLGFNVIITGDREEKKTNTQIIYSSDRIKAKKCVCVCSSRGKNITHTHTNCCFCLDSSPKEYVRSTQRLLSFATLAYVSTKLAFYILSLVHTSPFVLWISLTLAFWMFLHFLDRVRTKRGRKRK